MQVAGSSSKAMALSLIGAAKNSPTRVERDPGTVPVESSIQSVRKMEQACFKEMNRLVRTRMLGGVGGARRKPAPIPIVLLYANLIPALTFSASEHHSEHKDKRRERRFWDTDGFANEASSAGSA